MSDDIALGDIAKDDLTGFEGVVTQRTFWLSNCDRLTLQPKELKEGKPQEAVSFDITHCTLITKGAHKRAELQASTQREDLKLGDTVRDSITGFEGVIIGRAKFLATNDRIGVQPKSLNKEGQPQAQNWFDAAQLELVSKLEPPAPKETRGGPMPEPRRQADATR
jgi:hypothetical protein